ncbi:MAG: hypothetical protein ABIQ39_09185, partial [Ilumatobacteraceae bacterium]
LQVNGRRDELIITGGENVWPAQVEEVLRIHHDVADVAVTGLNDPEWGQRVVAWVVATPGATPNIDALRGHVRSMLPAFMAPKEVRLVAAIPRTSLGKVARQLLSSTTFTAS